MKRLPVVAGLAAATLLGVGAVHAATEQLDWKGGPSLNISVPGRVTISQGPVARVVVSGPRRAVDKVYMVDGNLRYHRDFFNWFGWNEARGLRVEITAPSLASLSVHAGSNVNLVNLTGDRLDISVHSGADLHGAASVNAMNVRVHSGGDLNLGGRATRLTLAAHSGADADLGRLAVDHAQVTVHSGGDVTVNPRLSVKAEAHSGGDIRLLSRPVDVVTSTHSGGDIRMP